MVLNRLIGHVLLVLTVWAVFVIIGRLKAAKYGQYSAKLTGQKDMTELESAYQYYYSYSMNYLSVAVLSVLTLALAYYLPVILSSYFGIDEMSKVLVNIRRYGQLFAIILTFFGFVAHHRCHYQVDAIYRELNR